MENPRVKPISLGEKFLFIAFIVWILGSMSYAFAGEIQITSPIEIIMSAKVENSMDFDRMYLNLEANNCEVVEADNTLVLTCWPIYENINYDVTE